MPEDLEKWPPYKGPMTNYDKIPPPCLVAVSEAFKSHFIEQMHLLQGAWHRTPKSRADFI